MSRLEKFRGERRWRAWLSAKPRFISDALVLLGKKKKLYLAIHEFNAKKDRWVCSVALQTVDPAEE